MQDLRFCLMLLALGAAACTHSAPPAKAPAPQPVPESAPGASVVQGSAIVLRRASDATRGDTGQRAIMARAAMARADSVAARVKTLEIAPDSIVLAVGDTIPFPFPARVTARDSSGRPLDGFVPFYSIANGNIARMRLGGVVGISEGRTALRVDAMVRGDGRSPLRRTAHAEVPLIVHAGTHGVDIPTDSVPRELVLALLGTSNPRDVALRVGGAADDIPPAVLRDARVLGSSVSAAMSTTVAILPYSALAAGDTVEARFLASAWTRTRPYGAGQPGFVSSVNGSVPVNTLCDQRGFVTYRLTQRDPWSTTVALSYRRAANYTPCHPRATNPPSFLAGVPMPSLDPPPKAQVQGGGMGGGGDNFHAEARISDGIDARDALTHYVARMKDAGWELVAQAPTPNAALATFTRTAPDGMKWFATLTVMGTPQSTRLDLTLMLRKM